MSPAQLAKSLASAEGFDLVGVAPAARSLSHEAYMAWLGHGYHSSMAYLERHALAKQDPRSLLAGARSILMVGLNYSQPIEYVPGFPRIARYAQGRDYHKVIRSRLRRVARALDRHYPEHQYRICVDSAPLLEREFASRAGLGWIGKNTLLINSHRGSWFLLGALLTTLEMEPDIPAEGGCGTCRECIDACPTGCIVLQDGRWQIDARRCISYLTIEHRGEIEPDLQQAMDNWTFGCDVCQEVCPFNHRRPHQPQRADYTTDVEMLPSRAWPKLRELRAMTNHVWDELSRGSPIRRSTQAGWQRNVEINLTNLSNNSDGVGEVERADSVLGADKP